MIYYLTPSGQYLPLYDDVLNQAHVLIAGQTGSGKSVIMNGIIKRGLLKAPCECEFILLDPKKIELYSYRKFPHTIAYASDPNGMLNALIKAESIMDNRYYEMQKGDSITIKSYEGSHIYIIIDELADLLDISKACAPIITRIGRLGRAAKVHLIVATQYLGGTIPPEIKRNLSAVIGLHTRTAADSRYLIEQKGCEAINIGECLYYRPTDAEPQLLRIPYAGDEAEAQEVERLYKWWSDPANIYTD